MKPGKGMGGVYQPTFKDRKTGEKRTLSTYWIYYSRNGEQVKESSNSTREADAWKLLKRRHGEIAEGKPVGPDITRTTFEDMAAMLVNDYKANGRSSLNRCEDVINHLRGVFGEDRAVDITADRITQYVTYRQEEKAAASTINGELAAIGRMFVLARIAGKAGQKPYIKKLNSEQRAKRILRS